MPVSACRKEIKLTLIDPLFHLHVRRNRIVLPHPDPIYRRVTVMNVLMLYPKFPEQTFWNTARSVKLLWGRKAIMPPLGLLTIASYLPEDFSLRLVDRNVAAESDSDWAWADVVFLSVMMAQQDDYRECVANAKMRGKPIAVGGPFTHALPEDACADADWVCFGEAEDIMEQLVSDLRADRRGQRYQGGAGTNMERVKIPRFELLPDVNDYATMALQFSRGCPFKCEFCDIIEIYGRVPRTKTPSQVCAELAEVERLGFQGYIFLVDDNFIGNKRKAKEMLAELATWNRAHHYPFRYYTEASINLADDDELLERMRQAGFFHVFIGIETPDPKLLKTTQKMQNIPGSPLAKLARVRRQRSSRHRGFYRWLRRRRARRFRGATAIHPSFRHRRGNGRLAAGHSSHPAFTALESGRAFIGNPQLDRQSYGGGNQFYPEGRDDQTRVSGKLSRARARYLSTAGLFRANRACLAGATGKSAARRGAPAWGAIVSRFF